MSELTLSDCSKIKKIRLLEVRVFKAIQQLGSRCEAVEDHYKILNLLFTVCVVFVHDRPTIRVILIRIA